jgi:hypothetical protein
MSTTTTTTLTSPIGAVGSSGSYLVTGGGGGGSNMGSPGYLAGYGPTPSPVTITTGGTGYYSTPITTTNTAGWTTMATAPNTANIKITGNNPKLSTDKNDIDLDELADTMRILRDRFLILIPDFEKHEKYAALKKAYDHYKLIEAMLQEEKKDDK